MPNLSKRDNIGTQYTENCSTQNAENTRYINYTWDSVRGHSKIRRHKKLINIPETNEKN